MRWGVLLIQRLRSRDALPGIVQKTAVPGKGFMNYRIYATHYHGTDASSHAEPNSLRHHRKRVSAPEKRQRLGGVLLFDCNSEASQFYMISGHRSDGEFASRHVENLNGRDLFALI